MDIKERFNRKNKLVIDRNVVDVLLGKCLKCMPIGHRDKLII